MIEAKVICDSINLQGNRITTMIVTFPRFLLAEFNTHRMLSRNSASSRAIRFEKMVESVQNNPFIPIAWQRDHAGMQGVEYIDEVNSLACKSTWLEARDLVIEHAAYLNEQIGVTKQLCNRLLEPYMMHTCLVTATEWENFFALRYHKDAEIHFQALAEEMLQAMNDSEPKKLIAGEWHIPFGDQFDEDDIWQLVKEKYPSGQYSHGEKDHEVDEYKVKLATVRCARISYLTQDKVTDYTKDLELHDRLSKQGHWSAFEHCAVAMNNIEYNFSCNGGIEVGHLMPGANPQSQQVFQGWIPEKSKGWCGNFRGFIQYRKMFQDENRVDSRLLKKGE